MMGMRARMTMVRPAAADQPSSQPSGTGQGRHPHSSIPGCVAAESDYEGEDDEWDEHSGGEEGDSDAETANSEASDDGGDGPAGGGL